MSRRRGLTLVELLVTTSLMALVGGAAVSALASGIRVWERAAEIGVYRQAVLVGVAQLRRDLRNARTFSLLPFEGGPDRFGFATVGKDQDDGLPELARVGYFLDQRSHVLCRSFVPYRRARRVRLSDRCEPVLEDVSHLRFSYFGAPEEGDAADWLGRWEAPQAPMAVKIDLVLRRPGRQPTSHSTVISLGSAMAHGNAAQ